MLCKSTVPHFYATIKTNGVNAQEVLVQNVAVTDDLCEAEYSAIEAAAFEEQKLLRAAEEKQERLKQFQNKVNARLAASRRQKMEEDKENKTKERNTIAQIQNSCRALFAEQPPPYGSKEKATAIQNENSDVTVLQRQGVAVEKGTIMSSKRARNKLVCRHNQDFSESCSTLQPTVTVIYEPDTISAITQQDLKVDNSRRGTRKGLETAKQRDTFRKTVMKLERERAHERAQLLQKKKSTTSYGASTSSHQMIHVDKRQQLKLDLELELPADIGENDTPPPSLSGRTADTYLVEEKPCRQSSSSCCTGGSDEPEGTASMHNMLEAYSCTTASSLEKKRFRKAVRASARDQAKAKNVTVPPLCACWETFWDHDQERCANNCPFYKNKKLYNRIAQSMLQSFDINVKWLD